MSAQPAEDTAAIDSWIVVDLERISALPERLRRLWPADLLPQRTAESRAAERRTAESRTDGNRVDGHQADGNRADEDCGAASGKGEGGEVGKRTNGRDEDGRREVGKSAGGKRELDVLTAWLRGFATELNRAHTRISVVVSSGLETVHLALCLGPGIGHAILALHGEGLEDFEQRQLLRRLELSRIAHVVDDLTELVDRDCVLTLSWAGGDGATGLEFLRRKGGNWFRPVIDRDGDSITVDDDVAAGEAAVRQLLSSVLTRALTAAERISAVGE